MPKITVKGQPTGVGQYDQYDALSIFPADAGGVWLQFEPKRGSANTYQAFRISLETLQEFVKALRNNFTDVPRADYSSVKVDK